MNRFYSQLFFSQFDYGIAGNSHKDIIIGGRCDELTIYHQENVFPAPLGDMAVWGEHDSLVKTVTDSFRFCQGIVDIDAGGFNLGRNYVVLRAVPGRYTAAGFIHIQVRSPWYDEHKEVILQVMQAHAQRL